MIPKGLLEPSGVSLGDAASSKKRILEHAAQLLVERYEEPTAEQIFERLLERERLGSTGLAGGVALPHARMPKLDKPRAAFLRLEQAVDFDALDGQPVDLVFALLVPEEANDEHLQLLASLAAMFNRPRFCARLRDADAATIVALLTGETDADGD
jgi:PTS system nitrogen regulatory IIA component